MIFFHKMSGKRHAAVLQNQLSKSHDFRYMQFKRFNMLIYHFIAILLLCKVEQILSQNYLISDIDFNVQQFTQHKTKEFYSSYDGDSDVIIRRGAHFIFTVNLNRRYFNERIKVSLKFDTKYNGSMTINLPSNRLNTKWILNQYRSNRSIHGDIYIPGDAPVGVWSMQVTLLRHRKPIEVVDLPNRIITLFNPWSKADAAYFPDKEKLEEYVMNEKGYTFSYDFYSWHPNPWIFGQFQPEVLDALLFVFERSRLPPEARGDIVTFAREITHLLPDFGVNKSGILRGKWKEPYDPLDGEPVTKPWEWTGSPGIYQQFYKSGGKAVGYGQCYVFAGILTTALRAFGIPARPVTNLVSAHSKYRDLTIDTHLDENGNVMSQELVWNFHVWAQAWLSRKNDLGDFYSGWQELDASAPFRIGPTSTKALQNSHLRTNYDSAFLYEGVNADEVVWQNNKTISVKTDVIGMAVLTKQAGGIGAEDITRLYKPPEHTDAERESYRKAALSMGINPPSLNQNNERSSKQKIVLDIKRPEKVTIGSKATVTINVQRTSLSRHQIHLQIKAKAMYYNGVEGKVIKVKKYVVNPATSKPMTIKMDIEPNEYMGKLRNQYTIRVEAVAKSGKQLAFKKKSFSLNFPVMNVSAPKSVRVNQTYEMRVQIKNPFNYKLTHCYIAAEGTRIRRKVMKLRDIPASSSTTALIALKPLYARDETIVVHFYAGDVIERQASTELRVIGRPVYQFANYVRKPRIRSRVYAEQLEAVEESAEDETAVNTVTREDYDCCSRITFF